VDFQIFQLGAFLVLVDKHTLIVLVHKALPIPYVEKGRDPSIGFDCWGLVYWLLKSLGSTIPDYTDNIKFADDEYNIVLQEYHKYGKKVDGLIPGDLIFFRRKDKTKHVGMYIGSGDFVHCTEAGVHISSIEEQPLKRQIEMFIRILV
jgi:cell wall-associated NlpC family hydrolase